MRGQQPAQTGALVASVLNMPAQAWITLIFGLIVTFGVLAISQQNIAAHRSEWQWLAELTSSGDEDQRDLGWLLLTTMLETSTQPDAMSSANNSPANDLTVRILAAKVAVAASKKSGRPVDPRVAKLAASWPETPPGHPDAHLSG